jgi:putative SbcD/Mre11-related phosphoesterase
MLTPLKDYPAFLHKGEKNRTLIVTDLHLGWEINLIRKGVHLPSQMPKIRKTLLQLIKATKPDALVILGDVKHTIAKAESGEWHDIPEFFEAIMAKVDDIRVVRGNHDGNLEPLLPLRVELHSSTGITLNETGLFHGHTWPARKLLECDTLVMGHVHPTVMFRDYLGFRITTRVWVKARCHTEKLAATLMKRRYPRVPGDPTAKSKKRSDVEPKVKQLFIMPCFNDFLGGRPLNKDSERRTYIGPLLRSEAINMDEAEVYLLDGTFLGLVEQLKGRS